MNLDFLTYSGYMEGLAASNVDIKHDSKSKKGFFGLNAVELSADVMKLFKTKNIMVLSNLSASATMNGQWRPLKYKAGFMILQPFTSHHDFKAEEEVMNETLLVGLQVVSKIIKDIESDDCPSIFGKLKNETVQMGMVAPTQSFIGWEFSFPIVSSGTITFNSEKWQ
jgi:hypothetical protein